MNSTRSIGYVCGAGAAKAGQFAESVLASSIKKGVALDSATGSDVASEMQSRSGELPEGMAKIFDSVSSDDQGRVLAALSSGLHEYQSQHGVNVPPDVVHQALHNGAAALDSATSSSEHSNNRSLNPDPVIVAIHSTLVAAIPFAHYAPANKSGEAKIGILRHVAGSDAGMYRAGDSIDGVAGGEAYLTQTRAHKVVTSTDGSNSVASGKITMLMTDRDTCDQNAAGVKVRRGRAEVFYQGVPVAQEVSAEGVSDSVISGRFTVGAQVVTLSGSINPDNGEFALSISPTVPDGTELLVETQIDVEADETLIPLIGTEVSVKSLYAASWTARARTTKDSQNQMQNELNVDPIQASTLAINAQLANERHHLLLQKAIRLAKATNREFDLDYEARKANMTIKDMWRDLMPVLAACTQTTSEATNSSGMHYVYIGPKMLPFFRGLPSDLFQFSGLTQQPGIHRIGRLSNGMEVYYTPKGLSETNTAAELLVLSRSNEVARAAFVLGDVNSPVMEETAKGASLAAGVAMHCNNYTTLNPHRETLNAAIMVNIINMPQ